MNERINNILEQIKALEHSIQQELNKQKVHFDYRIHGGKIEFEHSIREMHRHVKVGFFRWLRTDRPLNYLTSPIIYSMIIPLLIFDILINLYQWTCFPVYGVSRVRRREYFAFDHRHLAYLNFMEKFNCLYCSYANGLMAFSAEIVARTEQYFCPIKHARKLEANHARYKYFIEYGDAENLHAQLQDLRNQLITELSEDAKGKRVHE